MIQKESQSRVELQLPALLEEKGKEIISELQRLDRKIRHYNSINVRIRCLNEEKEILEKKISKELKRNKVLQQQLRVLYEENLLPHIGTYLTESNKIESNFSLTEQQAEDLFLLWEKSKASSPRVDPGPF